MGITGANRCYFVVWNPHETHIEIIEFDSVFFRNTKNDGSVKNDYVLPFFEPRVYNFYEFISHDVILYCTNQNQPF